MLEGVQLGTIEGYAIPADFFTGADRASANSASQFLFRDTKHANKTLADPELNAYILSMANRRAWSASASRVAAESMYFGGKKPLRTLAAFKGRNCASTRRQPNAPAWPRLAPPRCRWAFRK